MLWADRLRKLAQLSWTERYLLAQTLWMLPWIRLAIHLLGLRRVQRTLTRLARVWPVSLRNYQEGLSFALSAGRMVNIAARYGVASTNCLARAVALCFLLQLYGLEGSLRIGVSRLPEKIEAHAWVEYNQVVLNDRQDIGSQFAVFDANIDFGISGAA